MSWWGAQPALAPTYYEPRIDYTQKVTATGTTHALTKKLLEGEYILHTACINGNDPEPMKVLFFIYRHIMDYAQQLNICYYGGVATDNIPWNLPRTIRFSGPATIQVTCTSPGTDIVSITLGLEKVRE